MLVIPALNFTAFHLNDYCGPQSAITWYPKSVHAVLIVILSGSGGVSPPRALGAGLVARRGASRMPPAFVMQIVALAAARLYFAPHLPQPS